MTKGVRGKLRRAARQSLAHGALRPVDRRDLLDAAAASGSGPQLGPLCRVDVTGVCELDYGFSTTLGPPATDTQRAIAYDIYTEATACGRAGDHLACAKLRAAGRDCVWDGASCDVDIMPDPSWLLGRVYCPGSLAHQAADCMATAYDTASPYRTPQARCFARPGCAWLEPAGGSGSGGGGSGGGSASGSSGLSLAGRPGALLVPALLAEVFALASAPSANGSVPLPRDLDPDAGLCAPAWAVLGGTRAELEARIPADVLQALATGDMYDMAALYLPVYDTLFGTCPGVQPAKRYLASGTCASRGEEDCELSAGCEFVVSSGGLHYDNSTASWVAGGRCIVLPDVLALVMDLTDPWLDAGIRAEVRCAAAGEDAAACAAVAGGLPVNATLWESYRDMRPSWMRPKGPVNGTGAGRGGGSGGSGGHPSPSPSQPARPGSSGSPPGTNSGSVAAAWRPLVLSALAAAALTLAAHLAA